MAQGAGVILTHTEALVGVNCWQGGPPELGVSVVGAGDDLLGDLLDAPVVAEGVAPVDGEGESIGVGGVAASVGEGLGGDGVEDAPRFTA